MKFSEVERAMFGDHTIGKSKVSGLPTLTIHQTYQGEDESNARYSQLQKRQLIKQDNVVSLVEINKETKRSLCSKTYHIYASFEYIENYLKKEMIRRKKLKNPFNELELTRIFFDLVEGYAALQTYGVKIGEINPVLVWILNDATMKLQRARVIERNNLSKDQRTNLINTVTVGMDVYMDPLQYVSLFNNNLKPLQEITNSNKLDSFALGLVILEAGILESIQPVYDTQKGVFNHEKLSFFLKKFYMLYGDSSLVSTWVTKMLGADWHQRPDFTEIKNSLPNWYEVKVAIGIGNSEAVGVSGYQAGPAKSTVGEPVMDNISRDTYNQSQMVTPPVQLSLVMPRTDEVPKPMTKKQVYNDFDFDPGEFVPTPTQVKTTEVKAPTGPTIQPFTTHDQTVGTLTTQSREVEPHTGGNAPEFDFFNYDPGHSNKKIEMYKAYTGAEPVTNFSAQNFSSFKVMNESGQPQPSEIFVPEKEENLKNQIHQKENDPKFSELETPSFAGTGAFGEIEKGFKISDEIQGYIKQDAKPGLFSHNLQTSLPPAKDSLMGDGLLSVIKEKEETVKAPGAPQFSIFDTDSQFTPAGPVQARRKPINDFHSGISDIGSTVNMASGVQEPKMNLSNYLKNLASN